MTFAVIVSTFFCFSINSFAAYPGNVPLIYVTGAGHELGIKQDDGSWKYITYEVDKQKVVDAALAKKDVFIKAFLTQDWSDFCDVLIDIMKETFDDCRLDENGEPTDGSRSTFEPTAESVKYRYDAGGDLGSTTFIFESDWRLDPLENMDELESYINLVLEVTGSDKYAICGRCEGASTVLQWLDYYKNKNGEYDPRITDVIMFVAASNGVESVSSAFSGKMHLEADAVERFVYDTDFGLDTEIGSFNLTDESLREILTIVSNAYGLDLGCWAANNVYSQIYFNVVPEALRYSYGTFPGYWTMVTDDDYEDAKKLVFGDETEKYAGLIAKIDRYHNEIAVRTEEILKGVEESGIEVSNIVKYGFQIYPYVENPNVQSDRTCGVELASWGATTTPLGETFSDDYIKNAVAKGTAKYISPDLCIDASTTFLKDTTWFIKNFEHSTFHRYADKLIFAIVNTNGMTVETYKELPQYLYFDTTTETISPYDVDTQKVNLDNYFNSATVSFARKIKPAFKYLFKFTTIIIRLLMPKVKS